MKLNADEPGMVLIFDDLRQDAVGRHSGESHSTLLKPALVSRIDLVAMPMAFGDFGFAVNLRHAAAAAEDGIVGPEPHRSTEITACGALLQFVALEPLRHQADNRLACVTELRGVRTFDSAQVSCRFEH